MAVQIVADQARRTANLGVDPRLVLVFETNAALPADDFRPANLSVLDSSSPDVVVAFADDPALAAFLDRLRRYQGCVQPGRRSAPYEGFFDSIDRVRRYGAEDRVTDRLRGHLESLSDEERVLVDVECWFPDDQARASEWLNDVAQAADAAGAVVVDRYLNAAAMVAMLRIEGQVGGVRELAELDVIAQIDWLPTPLIWVHEATSIGVSDLPELPGPVPNAPIVGLIDSGVRSAHPLLSGTVLDAVAMAGLPDGEDREGHGTAVGSLIARGPIEDILGLGIASPALCRILSVRVLDEKNAFPINMLWAHELDLAIRYCATHGARIINISIGDIDTPYRGPKSSPVAGLLDTLAKELGLVLIVAAGNCRPIEYEHRCSSLPNDYPTAVLESQDLGILDPAPAALAITVGAIVSKDTVGRVGRLSIGRVGWPSAISRRGPGILDAMKPELVAPGGTMAWEPSSGVVHDQELECLVADGSGATGGIITSSLGTSLSAPIVTRVAAAIEGRYPGSSSNLIRALMLQGSDGATPSFLPLVAGEGAAGRVTRSRRLVGYGEIRMDEAVASQPNRAVLIAEESIPIDGVHTYLIPIPDTFFAAGGERSITVSLAYDPDTRSRRLDYLSSRMKFELVRGVDIPLVERLFLAAPNDLDPDASSGDEDETDNEPIVASPSRLSDLSGRQRPKLEPSSLSRSVGAHQLGRKRFHQRLRREDGESFLLVVQNTNRWAPAGSSQSYAVAVALWRSDAKIDLYTELAVAIRQQVEQQIEVETRVRA